jgi:hypothetical protein
MNNKSPDRYDQESIPSGISQNDMWGELPKYEQYKYQQQIKKEKIDQQKKKRDVMQVLDQQISHQRQKKQEERDRIKEMD